MLFAGAPGPFHWQWPSQRPSPLPGPSLVPAHSAWSPRGCYLWGSFLEWHLPPALLWLGSRAQPPPTETPVGPAPGVLAGARFPLLLPYFSDSPRLSSSMEHLPGAWRGCGGQPSVQWISCPALSSSSWWCWGFSSPGAQAGPLHTALQPVKLGPSLASLVRPGLFPSGQLTWLLS